MAEITKPDMSSLWASGGAVIAPTSAKIKTGWTPEIPPHQWENFVQNRQDNAIAYLFQRGVPEWDSSTEYFNNKSLAMGSDGILYRAVSNNVGVNPTTDSGANWISLTANASESVAGMIKIATTAQANAMTDDNVAITPAKLGGLLGTKSIIAGNGLTGGGALNTTRTLTLGTPSTLNGNTTNSVTTNSHTHALASASESIAGVSRIATTVQAQAMTDDAAVITPKKLGDAMNSHVPGVGQAWENWTSARFFSTTYTNTTGRPMMVAVSAYTKDASGPDIWLLVNGVQTVTGFTGGEYQSGLGFPLCVIVPSGHTYRLETTDANSWLITQWVELR